MRGQGPESLDYDGNAAPLQRVWIAVRANLRAVMDTVTLADIAADRLPPAVAVLSERAEAWSPR